MIFDSAHNQDSFEKLRETLEEYWDCTLDAVTHGGMTGPELVVRVLGVPAIPDRPDIGRRELILAVLLACRGGTLAASAAQDALWGGKPVEPKTVWNFVAAVRRALGDFEYEFQLAHMNRHLAPEVETLFMMTAEETFYVSSSLVKEVAQFGGDITALVPPGVAAALRARLGPGNK